MYLAHASEAGIAAAILTAAAARREALRLAEKLSGDVKNARPRIELLMISGAMRHYLGDDPGALQDFANAAALTFCKADLPAEQNRDVDGYLAELPAEYDELPRRGGSAPGG